MAPTTAFFRPQIINISNPKDLYASSESNPSRGRPPTDQRRSLQLFQHYPPGHPRSPSAKYAQSATPSTPDPITAAPRPQAPEAAPPSGLSHPQGIPQPRS